MPNTHISDTDKTPQVHFDIDAISDAVHPEWFRGVHEARLGKAVGITQFGANHVTLEPGTYSALRHWHEGEDEFVFVLHGTLTLVDENGAHILNPGSFVGFPAGEANAHHLVNRSEEPATYLAIGSCQPGKDMIHYPDDNFGPVRR